MARNTFDEILDRCVSMLHAGVSIDDAVAPYPAQAPALRERLAVAQTLSATIPRQQLDAAMLARTRSRFLAAVRERFQGEPAATPASSVSGFLTRGVRRLALVPYALPAVAAMVLLGGAAAGIAAGTGNSNPAAWFAASGSSDHEIKLHGTIVSIDATSITIATDAGDTTVQLTPETELKDGNDASLIIADFAVGDVVEIRASRDVSGALVAHEVEREQPDDDGQPPGATATDNSNPGPGGPTDDNEGADDAEHETPDQDDEHDATPESADAEESGPSDDIDDDHEGANRGSALPVLSSEGDGTEPETGRDEEPWDSAEQDARKTGTPSD